MEKEPALYFTHSGKYTLKAYLLYSFPFLWDVDRKYEKSDAFIVGGFIAHDLEIDLKGNEGKNSSSHRLLKWSSICVQSVQSLSHVWLFGTPWTAACQAYLFITNSLSLLKLKSNELVMPSKHLILCHSLLLPSIFPSIRAFSNESVLCIRWPKFQLLHQSFQWIFRTDLF